MKQIWWICIILLVYGCKHVGNSTSEQAAGQNDTTHVVTPKFTHPEVPALMTDQNQRIEYLVRHYWDYFDFADTTYVPTPDITEQAWADYIDLLFRIQPDKAQEAMKGMMTKSAQNSKKLFLYFTGMAEHYLYEPNSPARNEELYIPVLETMIQTTVLDETEKIRPRLLLDWALKNRIGTKATDFQYTIITGQTGSLYRISTGYTLLFFNNPECTSCVEHIEIMRNSVILNRLIKEGKLKILSIFPDREVDIWKKHAATYPADWIVGYDPSFTIGNKYDLKASPTLYLLDEAKTVLNKDASLPQIDNYLHFVLQQN